MLWSSTINFMQIQNKVGPRFKIMDKTYFQERPWTWSWRRWSTRWWRTWTARRPTLLACPGRSSAMTGSNWPQTQTGKHILKTHHIVKYSLINGTMSEFSCSTSASSRSLKSWRGLRRCTEALLITPGIFILFIQYLLTCYTYSSFYSDVSSWATLTSYGWWKRYSNYCQ